MSIVALKRKANATKNANISGQGSDGFALNGVYRNQGWVGQTSQFRQYDPTCMPEGNQVNVKSSVLSTTGMIATKYQWIRRPAPYAAVSKPISERTQENYIDYLHRKRLAQCVDPLVKPMREPTEGCQKQCVPVPNMPRKTGAVSSTEYQDIKFAACAILNNDFDENRQIIQESVACPFG